MCYNVFYVSLSGNISGYTALYKYKIIIIKADKSCFITLNNPPKPGMIITNVNHPGMLGVIV